MFGAELVADSVDTPLWAGLVLCSSVKETGIEDYCDRNLHMHVVHHCLNAKMLNYPLLCYDFNCNQIGTLVREMQ